MYPHEKYTNNFRLRSQISPKRMKTSTSGKRRYQPQSIPRLANFEALTTELTRLMFTHPNSTSLKGHNSAPIGCCPSNFHTCYRMSKAC